MKDIAQSCKGKKLLKPKPGGELRLLLANITEDEFTDLFENLEEVHACIIAHRTKHEDMNFGRLRKLAACRKGEFYGCSHDSTSINTGCQAVLANGEASGHSSS